MHAQALELRFKSPVDRDSAPFYAASLLAHFVALLVIMSFPDNAASLELDGHMMEDRFLQLALTPEQMEPEPQVAEMAGPEAPGSAAHKGEEGAAGREDAEVSNKKLAIKGPSQNEDIELRKARDLEIASTAGIAGTLQVESPWGTSPESIGSDAMDAIGAIDGSGYGDNKGIGALGVSGAGRGGGGDIEGSLGIDDRIQTKGRNVGIGRKAGCVLCGGKDEKIPAEVTWRPPVVDGGLDREIIQRIVRQHRKGIKACYEAELARNKKLAGEVKIKFTVAPTGRVLASVVQSSSLKNAKVETCMNNRIRRWVFPEPRGGQMVIVKYPFRFSSGG